MQLCISPEETITGFNYAFTAALLQKLKGLSASNRVWESPDDGHHACVTDMAASVISYLSKQTSFQPHDLDGIQGGSRIIRENLEGLIEHTEEFLSIFETSR
ncbi:MAG: hypothetical protein UY31_C0020G0011 [Candidatus Wolfebacteria bacterium GW2011_GWE1_48_7]|nr:MAG: hypothetical protein UX58_C0002G0137 [Candidatus Wolfebacteria bacterium GW2011_GWB2_46_69]KKU54207.1 MAG: hypothetical protein UX76_C0004G0011 [Candidatus Wolfebacteria bacterium GW2011_GWC1_47_103]KKU58701.1 MAG: hypothetical protein UX83_C0013G0011 [Candidatus Wolfebacteria bacterium GW2011_GWE2_47_12]KKU66220.1 MAG: hypothetical protein UX90_C0001G0279 [Candidatus Wolfebacteria bacterium GW2011_GWD2_47_17]KKU89403.1 MAG: hypothetical protein UY19_C0014G0003 [Candidatus Wolfebacteria